MGTHALFGLGLGDHTQFSAASCRESHIRAGFGRRMVVRYMASHRAPNQLDYAVY